MHLSPEMTETHRRRDCPADWDAGKQRQVLRCLHSYECNYQAEASPQDSICFGFGTVINRCVPYR
jgi:hypothetical protein